MSKGSGGFKLTSKGDWSKTRRFLKFKLNKINKKKIEEYALEGVYALREYTPVKTGETAISWRYKLDIDEKAGKIKIEYVNDNITKHGYPIALLIQYGHATRNGHWVQGIDYINPALKPIFEKLSEELWGEVKNYGRHR